MYFAPYIDASGVHLPTYQDRLDALLSSYRTIFGPEANLEISSPDYQLLSVFARALDDLSQLILVGFRLPESPVRLRHGAGSAAAPLYRLVSPVPGLASAVNNAAATPAGKRNRTPPAAAGCGWRPPAPEVSRWRP